MKVILQKTVQKLGKLGDVVESKPGYFRNYLEPRGIAVLASPGALKKREGDLENLRAKAERLHQEAQAVADKINAVGSIRIVARAGDGGKLYGKVTNKEIAEAISKSVDSHIDKKDIKVTEEINALGTYKTIIKVATEVQAEINIVVYDETQEGREIKEVKDVIAESTDFGADGETHSFKVNTEEREKRRR